MTDNAYGTTIPEEIVKKYDQTSDHAQAVIDSAILVWGQMGLSTAQIMYGVAMMNLESGDDPTITNGVPTSSIRGLGQVSDGTWKQDASTFDGDYHLAPGSLFYVPYPLNGPTNQNFNPTEPAYTNAQAGQSNDPAAGQYDPQGLVKQLEVVGQGIISEWNDAETELNPGSGRPAAGLATLIGDGTRGSSLLDPSSSGSSTLLATVALAYLNHHQGLSWWKNIYDIGQAEDYLQGTLLSDGTRTSPGYPNLQSVLDAFKQEFSYLQGHSSGSSSVNASGATVTTVTEQELNDSYASTLLYGDPWQLAGANGDITQNIPSIFRTPDDYLSQSTGGLSSYAVTRTTTNTGKVTKVTSETYTYTTKAGAGAGTDVVSGSATYNFISDVGSGKETLGNGSTVAYSETDLPLNGTTVNETATSASGQVLWTEQENRRVFAGTETDNVAFYNSDGQLQSASLVTFNLFNQTQIQGDYNSSGQLVDVAISEAFPGAINFGNSVSESEVIPLTPTQPDYAQIAQEYGLPTTYQGADASGSGPNDLLTGQGISTISSSGGTTFAAANAASSIQAGAVLTNGFTLQWSLNIGGQVTGRSIVGIDGSATQEDFNATGQYVGTSVATGDSSGIVTTETFNTSGAETGYSTETPYAAGSSIAINGVTTTYANGFTVTAQYGAPGAGGVGTLSGFSVSATVENSDGSATTTETDYTPVTNADGSATDVLDGSTVTTVDGEDAISTDYDASGAVTASRDLIVNADGSTTVENFDAGGALVGSVNLSMDAAGNVTLDTYDANGSITDSKTLGASGVLTDTTYANGSVAGESVTTTAADGTSVTTDLFAAGAAVGDSWIDPDGTYGSDTVEAGGGSSGTANYTDSSSSSSVNNGQGEITTTNYSSAGTVTGTTQTTIADSLISSNYTSADGSVQSTAVLSGDGSTQASAAESGGSSAGMALDPTDAFSWEETNSQGVATAVSLDSDGNLSGKTVTSRTNGEVVTIEYDPTGVETGYSLESTQNGVTTTTDYTGNVGQFIETGYTQTATGSNETTTTEYSVSGGVATETGYTLSTTDAKGDTTTTSYVANPDGDGTFVANGSVVVNVNLQGLVTKDEYDANGSLLGYVTERIDSAGDSLVAQYDSAGNLLQTGTVFASGVVQNVLYGTDSGTVTTTWQTDGSYQQATDDGEGDVTTTSYSAAGVALSDTWTQNDGSYGSDTYNPDGSSNGTAYNSDGSYSAYTQDPTGNTLTQYYSASGTLQAVENSLNDGQGDSVDLGFDASGDLTGQMWVTADGGSAEEAFSTQGVNFESNLTTLSVAGKSTVEAAQGGVIIGWGSQETLTAGAGPTLIDGVNPDDLIIGGAGNDTLEAFSAGTTLIGGSGNDLFEVNDPTDVVRAGTGVDSILSSVSYVLPTGVDVLTLVGTADLAATGNGDAANVITGNSGNDTLTAGSGNDTLVSGDGVDTLQGGAGPDTFVINNSADVIEQSSSQDTVNSLVSYDLTAAVGALNLVGSADLSVTDDYGHAIITGNAGNDTLIGGSGSDTLVAGSGADTFEAGSGNNTFIINNVDDVIETGANAGSDTVESSVNYTLGQGLDTLKLTGSASLQGEGNADAANLIEANSGSDTLVAGSGSDTLVGGSGNDTLVAGSGTDLLEGGSGSATYTFDSGFGQAEIKPGSGSGVIQFGTGISPTDLTVGLTADSSGNAALLIQDGGSSITVDGGLTGSIGSFDFAGGTQLSLEGLLAQASVTPGSIAGSSGSALLDTSTASSLSGSGNETILGVGASDTLVGGIGDEYLLGAGSAASINGGVGADTLVGAGAQDTVVAGNGNQQLYALGTGDVLSGGIGNDTLYGGAGADTLISGSGNTVMYGGAVADSIALTAGATATFYPSGTSSSELIELPTGMTFADFTAYAGTNGDLILESVSGGTTAVIKGFYSGGSGGKLWMISDGSGAQLLSQWLDTQQPSTSSGYQQEIDELRQSFAENLTSTLNQIGEQDDSIQQPAGALPSYPGFQYQFNGVTTDNVTVQGGAATLGNSEDAQTTSTTLQTGSTTYEVTTPVYQEVTVPGWQEFVLDSSLTQQEIDNFENASSNSVGNLSVQASTDASGNPGFLITDLPSVAYEQTGTKTTLETVPEYTTSVQATQSFVTYNVTGDGGNDVIMTGPEILDQFENDIGPYFVGTVNTGNGNVSVSLGMNNASTIYGHLTYDSGEPLPLGAFIQAGDGNDTVVGTGGADVIAAGTGFDDIVAGLGSTVYVPLQGASTEDITVPGPVYGGGPLPPSTLVLPSGIAPADLKYRLISGSADDPGETLQITDGNSTVLVNFSNSSPQGVFQGVTDNDWDGINTFQFSDGTVLTRNQVLAMAGPAIPVSDFNPTVSPQATTAYSGSTIAGASLFTGRDNTGTSPITWYQVSNTGSDGGHFILNGVTQTPGQSFYVSIDQLADLTYVAGAVNTTDTIQVSAFDGVVWGSSTSFNVNVAPTFQATGTDQEVTGLSSGPDQLVGGFAGDTLVGGSGQDLFAYNAGGGAEVISETVPESSTSANALKFGAGIAPAAIALSISADSGLLMSLGNGDSVSIEGLNPLDPLESFPLQSFVFSDGTSLSLQQLLGDSAVAGTSGSITNADGSTTTYDFTPSGQEVYYAQNVTGSGKVTGSFALNADGSQSTSNYAYNADGSYSKTVVSTQAGGGVETQVYDYNASGQRVKEQVQNPDGSTSDSTFVYNVDGSYTDTMVSTPAGGGASTTQVEDFSASGALLSKQVRNPDGSSAAYTYNAAGHELTADVTNTDGSTVDSTFAYNSDGSYTDTVVTTPSGAGASITQVYDYDASGHLVNEQAATGANQEIAGGSDGPQILVGGYQGDTLVGSSGEDTFEYGLGSGAEVISETAASSSTSDSVLQFGAGISPSSITLSSPGDGKLVLSIGNSGDSVTITGFDLWNPLQSIPFQAFEFSDGTVLSALQLLSDSNIAGSNGSVTNADGTTTSYAFAPPSQFIYSVDELNSSNLITSSVQLGADGSKVTTANTFNADGSISQNIVSIPLGGGAATTTELDINSQGQMVVQDITNPDGSTDDFTYTYNADGSRVQTEVATPLGGSPTTTVMDINSQNIPTSVDVTNPDGSTIDSTMTYNADGSEATDTAVTTPAGGGAPTTTFYVFNSQGQATTVDTTNPDGSTNDFSIAYNPDGSGTQTVVVTPFGGGSTTTVGDFNSQGQWTSVDVTNPDGSTDNTAYMYNADGSYTETEVVTSAGGGSTTTVSDINGQGQWTSINITNSDGSTDDTTYTYNADGSGTSTEVVTPAGGGGSAVTVADFNTQGLWTSANTTKPDGSTDDSTYTYNADGSFTQTEVAVPVGGGSSTTTVSDFNSQYQPTSIDITNPDASTVDSTFSYNADGSYSDTVISTPAGGGEASTTVSDYSAQGSLLSQNTYAPGTDGSYTDSWSKADGSHGSYWWNASTSEYQESWYNSDGNSWTDSYQYASGGSPGTTGHSYLETYTASDGSQGTRQYDTSTGAVTLSWDSASTGQLNGTTSDAGFIGLQNESELTNTQQDLTYFNPNVSPSFNAFLAGH